MSSQQRSDQFLLVSESQMPPLESRPQGTRSISRTWLGFQMAVIRRKSAAVTQVPETHRAPRAAQTGSSATPQGPRRKRRRRYAASLGCFWTQCSQPKSFKSSSVRENSLCLAYLVSLCCSKY